jgi:hypothetical protein
MEPAVTTTSTDTTPLGRSWLRIAGIAGIAATVIGVALGAGIASGAPTFVDPAEEIRAWFADNQGSVALFTWLMPLVFGPLLLTFAAGLRSRLAAVDTTGVLPRLSFSAAVAQFGLGLVGLAFWGVLTLDPVLESASDGLVVTLSALDAVTFFALAPWAAALFVVPASIVMLRTRVMPVWLGALGCLVGLASVVGGLWIFSGDPTGGLGGGVGFIGFLGVQLWVLITAVFLIRSPQT